MKLKSSALVLEGGGLRGVYTAGVLRFFMDHQLQFPYVIGVSMGACNGANYVARQPERNRIVNIRYIDDSRYLSYFRAFFGGELFGMKFLFDTIPHSLVPFDHQTFMENEATYVVVVTDCQSGKSLYYEKNDLGPDFLTVLQASCSLPFVSKAVEYKGLALMDGGISDSIPIRRSLEDGNGKNVVILTRPSAYRKSRSRFAGLIRHWYPNYPGLSEAFMTRYLRYNETLDFIDQLEGEKQAFVIRPKMNLAVGRVSRNKNKLYAAYDQGYDDAADQYQDLMAYLDCEGI